MDTAHVIARRGGIALLVGTLTVVACTASWPVVLVLGDDVTSAGDAAVPLFWCGLALLVLARVLGLIGSRGASGTEHEGPRRPTWGRRLAVAVLVVGAGAAAAFSWAFDSGPTSALDPASVGGCRVVVAERSFLMGGSGAVYVLPADGVVARRVSRYSTDDGYRPVESGSYVLTWAGERGHLEVIGSGIDPVWPRAHEVVCPSG